MLILGRKKGESVLIGDSINITVLDIQYDSVRLGVVAPREVKILRDELAKALARDEEYDRAQAARKAD